MTLHIFPCRVNAPDFAQAQEAVVALMLTKNIKPTEPPRPFICLVQYGDGPLWECYAKCEG